MELFEEKWFKIIVLIILILGTLKFIGVF